MRLDEKAFDSDGNQARHTQQYVFLPQAALIYKPIENLSLYTRYNKGLSLGGTAPWFANNADETLAPTVSRQIEAGVKYDWRRISFAAGWAGARQGPITCRSGSPCGCSCPRASGRRPC